MEGAEKNEYGTTSANIGTTHSSAAPRGDDGAQTAVDYGRRTVRLAGSRELRGRADQQSLPCHPRRPGPDARRPGCAHQRRQVRSNADGTALGYARRPVRPQADPGRNGAVGRVDDGGRIGPELRAIARAVRDWRARYGCR